MLGERGARQTTDRQTDILVERWEGETDRHMFGEMGGRQTIDRQTDILGGRERKRTTGREKGEGGGRDRETDVRGDGRETDD